MTEPHVMHLVNIYPDGGRLYVCLACGRERYVNFNTNPMQTRTITAGEDCLHIRLFRGKIGIAQTNSVKGRFFIPSAAVSQLNMAFVSKAPFTCGLTSLAVRLSNDGAREGCFA